jgi:ABC-2 type transport system permease protein
MQYKLSIFLTMFMQVFEALSAFFGIYFLFARFNSVEGFTFSEVLLCFATIQMSYAFSELFGQGFKNFSPTLSNGSFDRIMVRPRNEIFQVMASRIRSSGAGNLVQSICILCYAILYSGVHWTWDKLITLFLMVVGGTTLFIALFILSASFCFFTVEGLEFMHIFTDGGREAAQYPMAVYGKDILKFFTYLVPIACVQYYPLLYILGRNTSVFSMLTPLISFVFLLPCYASWRFGVRHYKSTGS